MFLSNVDRIMAQIEPSDLVLDIGGWAQPLRRADYVMDAFPYETRGWYSTIGLPPSLGEGPERFSKDTWIQRDICDREPFPFRDKSVDYVICSHVLEDIRDPLWVCSEMIRIAKKGYIEVPSRMVESVVDPKTSVAGAYHHRWLVTIRGNKISFEMKYHLIHRRGMHLPSYTLDLLRAEEWVQWLFWEGTFDFEEASIPVGEDDIAERLRAFVRSNAPDVSLVYRLLSRSRRVLSGLGWRRWVPRPLERRLTDVWHRYQKRHQARGGAVAEGRTDSAER